MNIVIASDSFKGTLSAPQICALFAKHFANHKTINATYIPLADGGEGTLEAIASTLEGTFISVSCAGPLFEKITTKYFLDLNNNAYIETASSAGLPLLTTLKPLLTTTYGLGEQIKDALKHGAKKIYLGLGGSATLEGGCGLFSALGTLFYHKNKEVFVPTGGTLLTISHFDNEPSRKLLANIPFIGLTDVTNPLLGANGAAQIFGPQKGATPADVKLIEQGLTKLNTLMEKTIGYDVSNIIGAGAAGGLGAGIVALGNGQLVSGITEILTLTKFQEKIANADYVISGEGKLDQQSFAGKVISGVAASCMAAEKKLILLVGISEVTLEEAQTIYPCIAHIIETNPQHLPYVNIKKAAVSMYEAAIKQVLQLLKN